MQQRLIFFIVRMVHAAHQCSPLLLLYSHRTVQVHFFCGTFEVRRSDSLLSRDKRVVISMNTYQLHAKS